MPDVNNEISMPETTPPIVSIEKDFPGAKSFPDLAKEISLTKVNPETMQKGRRTKKVNIRLTSNEGVSPVFKNMRDRKNIIEMEKTGLSENIRFIFFRSISFELAARIAPKEEPISHDPRKMPVTNSYPPAMFSISRNSRSCTDELTSPMINRLSLISDEVS
jgi:hypothetical protein